MRLLGILLVGLAVLALSIGLLNLWAGETEVLPRQPEVLESRTEGAEWPAIPSGGEFEAPSTNPPGPFYVP